jgi:hypothetical protein
MTWGEVNKRRKQPVPATGTVTVPSLSDAISAVEATNTAYQNAVSTTNNDQAAAADLQTRLTGAQAKVTSDQGAQSTAASAFNAALDALITAATASKVPGTQPGSGS